MMKRVLLFITSLGFALVSMAQPAVPALDIERQPQLSASNLLAYPGPTQSRLTPAPRGKKPFYLSHYGRHGSRHMTRLQDYDFVIDALQRADYEDKLSPLGRDVLGRIRQLLADAHNRMGELTPLGVQQHKDIARRMMERFPEVFRGDAVVEARSTIVVRCVLSMESTLQQMLQMNPRLRIDDDASFHDMYFMNLTDRRLKEKVQSAEARRAYADYCDRHRNWQRVTAQLFNDTAWVSQYVNGERLTYFLFRLAGSIQNTSLADKVTLYDLFTPEELLDNWRMENASWFIGYSHTPLNGGTQPFTQRNLLRRIVEQADSCIRLPRPGATLRFGHETIVLPLACLMGLNGLDAPIACLDSLEQKGWVNYRIFPMACNIQMVFYRRNPADQDVLVKVLLNEDEATLPLPTTQPPYYRWADVRQYFLKKLDSYSEEN